MSRAHDRPPITATKQLTLQAGTGHSTFRAGGRGRHSVAGGVPLHQVGNNAGSMLHNTVTRDCRRYRELGGGARGASNKHIARLQACGDRHRALG